MMATESDPLDDLDVKLTISNFGIRHAGHTYQVTFIREPGDGATRITIAKDGHWAGEGIWLESGHIEISPTELRQEFCDALEAAFGDIGREK